MDLGLVLDMTVSGDARRVLIGPASAGITAAELRRRAANIAAILRSSGASYLVFIGTSGAAFPLSLFAASLAAIPFVPLNYRLSVDHLAELVGQNLPACVVASQDLLDDLRCSRAMSCTPEEWLALSAHDQPGADEVRSNDPDDVALVLYTSGTTAAPKAALLRHKHLTSYVLATVEFQAAAQEECSLVSLPAYHIAGVTNTITNLYAGRRVVHLPRFTPAGWLDTVARERVTHALVVPTMLARIVEHLDSEGSPSVPSSLRSIAYGGAPMPARIIERALRLFPDTNFVNAYGLTETSSTIAVLGPAAHREALASTDPAVHARLGSAGQAVPGIELEIRGDDGRPLSAGQVGLLFVRGEQVSGEYRGRPVEQNDGWFATRDLAWLDGEGFLFIKGRADDTIIRGGENIAPAEIESVLMKHPVVSEAAVVGLPDEEWGQRIAAAVVLRSGEMVSEEALQAWARSRLRGWKTPDVIKVVDQLPHTDTGKLLRRNLVADLTTLAGVPPAEQSRGHHSPGELEEVQ